MIHSAVFTLPELGGFFSQFYLLQKMLNYREYDQFKKPIFQKALLKLAVH